MVTPVSQMNYSYMYISYKVTTAPTGSGDDDTTVAFYTSEPLYDSNAVGRYRLLPDVFSGQLSQYHCTSNTLITPPRITFIVKVSENVTGMTMTVGFIPAVRLQPCPDTTVFITDDCGRREDVVEYVSVPPRSLIGTPLGRFAILSDELKLIIEETSTDLILPIIPIIPMSEKSTLLKSEVLQEPPASITFSGARMLCGSVTSDEGITFNTHNDLNWACSNDNYYVCAAGCKTCGADCSTDIACPGLIAYNTGPPTIGYYRRLTITAYFTNVYNPPVDVACYFVNKTTGASGGYYDYIDTRRSCTFITGGTPFILGTLTSTSDESITATVLLHAEATAVELDLLGGGDDPAAGFTGISITTELSYTSTCP